MRALAIIFAVSIAAMTGSAAHALPSPTTIDGGCKSNQCNLDTDTVPLNPNNPVAVPVALVSPEVRVAEEWRAPFCVGMEVFSDALFEEAVPPACTPGNPALPLVSCPVGQIPLEPLWRREPLGDTGWGPWVAVAPSTCGVDPMAVEAAREFQSLIIDPVQVTIQPDESVFFTQMPVIVYVDPAAQTVSRTLLGQPVLITAVPTTYTWDWGDGESTTTTDPGEPWPDHTVSHTYERTRDDYDVTITPTTTWNGYYSLDNGATWVLIPGTATTQSPSLTFTAHTLHTRLVTCDLDGNCYD